MKLRLPTGPTQDSRIRHAPCHRRHGSHRDVPSVTLGHPESQPAGRDVTSATTFPGSQKALFAGIACRQTMGTEVAGQKSASSSQLVVQMWRLPCSAFTFLRRQLWR